MKFVRCISTIDSHTAGMPTRMVTAGIPFIPGFSMADKRQFVIDNLSDTVNTLIDEPRGHNAMRGAIITTPCDPNADYGVVFIGGGCMTGCGHSTIGIVTTILETGMLKAVEPETNISLDTPSGLVRTKATIESGKVTSVSMINVPAFLFADDVMVEIAGIGKIKVIIAFGGNFYAIVKAKDLNVPIKPEYASNFINLAQDIKEQVNRKIKVFHPEKPFIKQVSHVQFWAPPLHPEATMKNVVISPPGLVDRSPCGTGTCARMASLHTVGELGINQEFVHESVIGTLFKGRIVKEIDVGSFKAIVPEIIGNAFITGMHQFMVDPLDPLPKGFSLGH